jgi:hypothetical protein
MIPVVTLVVLDTVFAAQWLVDAAAENDAVPAKGIWIESPDASGVT